VSDTPWADMAHMHQQREVQLQAEIDRLRPLALGRSETSSEAIITPENIPQEWLDILDSRAGKAHSRQGSVVACLAEILNAALPALTTRHNTEWSPERDAIVQGVIAQAVREERERIVKWMHDKSRELAQPQPGLEMWQEMHRDRTSKSLLASIACMSAYGLLDGDADLIRARDSQ
jgi:hypothetical protein